MSSFVSLSFVSFSCQFVWMLREWNKWTSTCTFFLPGICIPSYLMSISCRPASVGEYFTVTVPSLLSVISGLATFPEGILTSPVRHWVHENLLIQIRTFLFDRFAVYSTCNFSLLDSERNDQVEGSQPSYVQSIHTQLSVCSLGGRRGKSDRSKLTIRWTMNSDANQNLKT